MIFSDPTRPLLIALFLQFVLDATPFHIKPRLTSQLPQALHSDLDNFAYIDSIFPPDDVESRNSISRKDGYWRYVQTNKPPPLEYTYGEFELSAFLRVVDCALSHLPPQKPQQDVTLTDLGSGAGRLVQTASLCYSFRLCRGVEILPSLHEYAVELSSSLNPPFPRSPTSFHCGSWNDKFLYLGDSDIVFVYSSCLGDDQRKDLTASLGSQLQPGAIVITTEYPLSTPPSPSPSPCAFEFETLEVLNDVENELVGGTSTVYVHRIVKSGWTSSLESWMDANRPTPEELEAQKVLNNIKERTGGTDHFLFRVQFENNCKFHNLPDKIWNTNNNDT
ncbi:hypothetical protein TL16_g03769 [Triparma laevis f. inornata]|uniref:Uncharacterized protein n=2 Tax=Triparma laevis TaxID=1534972 RepID=A0A9W7E4E8_9STRA|nr:hypothetical protein TL16_g03769 [Triparma laevis f. inornata]GMH64805.1 hypothetical protein TrLO_g4865 [Triparma laevis f. longispina]